MFEKLKASVKGQRSLEIIVNVETLEVRVAVMEEGRLENFFIERPSEERIVGSIFKGKIQNLEDGLQAAFVDIGMKKNAFIHYWDMIPEDASRLEAEEGIKRSRPGKRKKFPPGEMIKKFPIGSDIVVQVTKGAIGTKGPRVTANLSIPGRFLVLMPGCGLKGVSRKIDNAKERTRLKKILTRFPIPEGNGIIVRTAGSGARKTAFARDMRGLLTVLAEIDDGIKNAQAPCRLYQEPDLVERVVRDSLTEEVDRIVIDNRDEYERIRAFATKFSRRAKGKVKLYDGTAPIYDHFDIERQLESAFRRKVWLKSGGYIVFDETEALVAVDVNTGRHKGADNQEDSIFQVNSEAADEVARQLRLRNVGGLVVVDFIDMKQRRNQNAISRKLKDLLRHDKARTNVLPISELGLLEMTRQRMDESIRQTTYMDCPYCHGRGKIKSALSMSVEIQRRIAEVMRKVNKETGNPDGAYLKITVNPAVLDRLRKEDEAMLVEVERKHGGRLTFVADNNIHLEEFTIKDAESDVELYANLEQKQRQEHNRGPRPEGRPEQRSRRPS